MLQLEKFEGADFKYDNMTNMTNSSSKIPKNAFLVPNLSIFFSFLFFEILQLVTFKGADFKYDNIFLKFMPKSTRIRHCWSQI